MTPPPALGDDGSRRGDEYQQAKRQLDGASGTDSPDEDAETPDDEEDDSGEVVLDTWSMSQPGLEGRSARGAVRVSGHRSSVPSRASGKR